MSLSLGLGLALTRNKGGADALHGVQVQAARSPGRTFFRNGLRRSTALTDVATVTRATTAWGVDQGGNVSSFAAGQPVVNTAGLAVYEARTNSIRNPTGLGAVVGTPGTIPTNYFMNNSANGISRSVLGIGVENGLPYVDFRFTGTASATFNYYLIFEADAIIPALSGQTWTLSCFYKRVSSLAGAKVGLGWQQQNSSGVQLAADIVGPAIDPPLALTRQPLQGVNADASTAYVKPYMFFQFFSGTTYDETIRIAAPNLKQGADIGDPPILQTTNAAATRNTDVITEAVNIPVGQAFTVTGKWVVAAALSAYPTLFSLDDGSGASPQNLMSLYVHGDTRPRVQCISAGAIVDTNTNVAIAGGSVLGMAVSVSGSQVTYSVNGSVAASFTMPGGAFAAALLRAGLGCYAPTSAARLDGTVRDLNIVMRAYSSAELQAASDVTLTHDIDFVSQVYQYVGAPYVTPTDLPGTTFSRATTGTSRVGATILNFAAGVLKITSAGCLFEAQKTNVVRYSEGTTATIGTWGVSGSGPNDGANGVSQGGALNGLVISTSAKGTYADGCDWWEFTLAGTPTASSSTGFYLDANSLAGAASSGQTWVSAVDLEFMSMTGCTGSTIQTFGRKSDGPSNEGGGLVNLPTTPTSRARYASGAYTMADALTARVSGGVFFAYTSGVPLNVVVRVTAAQVERDYASSYKKTTGSAVTGNADILASANDPNPTAYTVVAEFTVPETGQVGFPWVWGWDDGTGSNRVMLVLNRSNMNLRLQIDTGGVTQAYIDLGTLVAGQTYKVAAGMAANDVAASINGAAVAVDTSVTLPPVTTFRYGHGGGGNMWCGLIRRVQRYTGRKTNSELQALAA